MAESVANTVSATTVCKVMTSSLTLEKRSITQSNGHASPTHQRSSPGSPSVKHTEALNAASISDKKCQTNGSASPSRHPNTQPGRENTEGYLKTDDRMRLAKERREERERSLAARDQAIKEKEKRARLQYEKTVEERWRRLEEQRQKEELRRAAVEEKRRQQLQEEKERLEAMMRKSLERSLQLENRSKRWVWGPITQGQGDWENAPPPLSAVSTLPHDLAAPSPSAIESGNVTHAHHLNSADKVKVSRLLSHTHSSLARCNSSAELHLSCHRCKAPSSPHKSPYRDSPSRRRNYAVPADTCSGTVSAPNTPKKERLRRERRTASPSTRSPVRKARSPDGSSATHKLLPKNQSACAAWLYPPSPVKHRAVTAISHASQKKDHRPGKSLSDPEVNRVTSADTPAPASPLSQQKYINGVKEKNGSVEALEKKHLKAESSDVTAKPVGGTTDAEEASRLLAERRRLARILKDQEDRQRREREEQERLKKDQLKKKQMEARARQDEEKKKREQELQVQMEKKKAAAVEDVERQKQEKELCKQQEEQERQQRKKRIEEIMKRTRKSDGEMKREDAQEPPSSALHPSSPPGGSHFTSSIDAELQSHTNLHQTSSKSQESRSAQQKPSGSSSAKYPFVDAQVNISPARNEQKGNGDKRNETEQMKPQRFLLHEVNKPQANREDLPRASRKPDKTFTEGNTRSSIPVKIPMNGPSPGSQQKMNGQAVSQAKETAAQGLQKHVTVKTSHAGGLTETQRNPEKNGKGGFSKPESKPSLPLIHLDTSGGESGEADEVQYMEVSPVSKEELISIPEFTPINSPQPNGTSHARALEDLLDLTGQVAYPRFPPSGGLGDCNRNLIEGVCSPTKPPASDKHPVQ